MKPRAALLLALFAVLSTGCAGVTAEDLKPHVATARDLAERNNAAIAVHCVGMDDDARADLIRANIDHATQLAALHQSADAGPGWLSNVIAWALSFSRLAGIVATDVAAEPDQALDPGTAPPAELPGADPGDDDDGDGLPDAEPTHCPGCPGCAASATRSATHCAGCACRAYPPSGSAIADPPSGYSADYPPPG